MGQPGDIEKSELLAAIEFFQGCTAREIDDIAKLAVDRHFAPGDELCNQGEADTEVFVLVEGEATVTIDGNQVAMVGTGDVVGELSMLGRGRRTATLTAVTPLHVLVMDPREVDSVLAADPSSAKRLGPRH
jgi:CRP-like cAMP-binding protein